MEGPTWLVVFAVYGGWGLLTWNYHALPWWLVLPLGGWLVAWYGSLQHEILHGHPTRNAWLNQALATPPLGLWLPYPLYRDNHLLHHRVAELTCPREDPESYYVMESRWRRLGPVARGLLVVNHTLAGRLLIGPFLTLAGFWGAEVRRVAGGDRDALRIWLGHGVGVALVLYWVVVLCGVPFWAYALLFVYPGLSLTLLRSYAEHRPAETQDHRTAIVEADPLTRLLFLNLNLHVLHHEQPILPWYVLPAVYRTERQALLKRNGGFRFSGYGDMARRYFFRPKDRPVHPVRA
jgi:fatty acid desaturase